MADNPQQKTRGRSQVSIGRITRDYIVALGLIAIFALVAAIALGLIINTQETAGAAINLTGRQRMLSQRIPLLALELETRRNAEDTDRLRRRLKRDIRLMSRSHERILSGAAGVPKPSAEVRALFFEPPVNLDKQMTAFLTRARRAAAAPNGQLSEENPDLRYLLRVSRSELPESLNKVVDQYETESASMITRLEALVRITSGIILVILVMEALVIFKPMVGRIRSQTRELERAFAEEHHIANILQKTLAPHDIPAIDGLEIKLRYQSATKAAEVGGDFYEFFELSDGRWGIVMGDVEGHGVDAATETARVKYLLRDKAGIAASPAMALKRLNDSMTTQGSERFTALTYAVYEPRTSELTLTNAANPYPYFKRRNSYLEVTGVPMGVAPHQEYENIKLVLESGDLLLMFSDGLVEARRGTEMFELERIRKFMMEHEDADLSDIVTGIVDAAQTFADGRLTDDILVIGIRKI